MNIGKTNEGKSINIDLQKLVESRLLLQANSGGGKSWAIRRLLEQTNGKIQQIVIDVEDEFHTLREKFDYILAGSNGDCPAETRSAALLARRLLELNVSAIIGIYELRAHDRIRFVRLFLDAMVNAPRELWHPVLVVVDEAHIFAPQQGEAESRNAVIDLMTRGRKRGFCGILATQRISKLHKDAAAEANNKLIGRSALDVDMKRAADELGFSGREDQAQLRTLKPGEFFCFGPALSEHVAQVKIGPIETTHPKAGERSAPTPPARDKVKKVLAQLADLPREAEEEAKTVAELRLKIVQLERVQKVQATPAKGPEKAEMDADAAELIKNFRQLWKEASGRLEKIGKLAQMQVPATGLIEKYKAKDRLQSFKREEALTTIQVLDWNRDRDGDGQLSKCGRAILQALAQFLNGRTASQVAIISGYSVKSGSFANTLSELRTSGFIEGSRELLKITQAGLEAVGNVPPPLTGRELLTYWMGKLEKAERTILEVLASDPRPWSKQEISDQTGYSATSGSFANALSRLRVLELITGRNEISIRSELI